jgi:8-oxo-dGTP pyrophosphatase MutT (NUDIX family)
MPKRRVRALAICLFSHEGRILASEGFDPLKNETFYRPLGGRIEFGETAAETVRRELLEEIQAEVTALEYLETLENIFVFNGEPGHEIVMVFDGQLADAALYGQPVIERTDSHSGELLRVFWKPLSDFGPGRPPLYPHGLLELLLKRQPPD